MRGDGEDVESGREVESKGIRSEGKWEYMRGYIE